MTFPHLSLLSWALHNFEPFFEISKHMAQFFPHHLELVGVWPHCKKWGLETGIVVTASRPGARFSNDPKLFGRISGDIILLVSLTRRRLEARNFAVILGFIPFTTYEKTSFTEYTGRSFTNGFSGPKSFREFRETAPSTEGGRTR